jgi:alginate O-acetyltransferase complex protein AlgI
MLFNSYPFLLGFFPAVLLIFFLLGRRQPGWAAIFLALASLVFYGYWSLSALPLLLASICANYGFGIWVTPAAAADPSADQRRRKQRLTVAVVINLAVLGYFKYANFFIDDLNAALQVTTGRQLQALDVVLPIGISFFTFTQIAFLVDCYEGKVRERNFAHYALFVSYFPHLISGPVLHHSQMMPQFRLPQTYRPAANNMVTGLLSVAAGLAKKVLLADEFSQYASPIFDAAAAGQTIGCVAAWTAALAYTLQIYFDFSGYSDMAVGLSRMLGIALPLNFDSPYKSVSIIEFWRRWHMSLSQFLRDYLYFRLGGNRHGAFRRYLNLMLTMLLGGLWHGASWTFVAWGGLHGSYLLINHAWRSAAKSLPAPGALLGLLGRFAALAVTFLAVVIGWVFFRSTTFAGAQRVLAGMFAPGPQQIQPLQFEAVYRNLKIPPTSFAYLGTFFVVGFAIVWLLPPTQAFAKRLTEVRGARAWFYMGLLLFCIALLAMISASHDNSEFIYFNF